MINKAFKIAVIGMGYVGLPLARLFATKYPVVGFDINESRIDKLNKGIDETHEIETALLNKVIVTNLEYGNGLLCSHIEEDLKDCNVYIITVPTPVDKSNTPDFSYLQSASEIVGKVLKESDIVVYESTVYPGATEEICVPILEKKSGFTLNQEFFVGYSPERINPGDKVHTVEKILKVTSGSSPAAAKQIDQLYASVIEAGTYLASSIKVAEAAKVIENSQRDINIAFVNELSKIFNLMGIDTKEVLKTAGTKWNFLPFTPGLVGGHCIGVDPYYLAQRAKEFGYHPEIILAGRRLNDSMGEFVASEVVKLMIQKNIHIKEAEVLVLGITFKENCPDVRNTRVVDVIEQLKEFQTSVTVYDPVANAEGIDQNSQIELTQQLPNKKYDAVVLAVAHTAFLELNIQSLLKDGGVIYDVKGVLDAKIIDGRL